MKEVSSDAFTLYGWGFGWGFSFKEVSPASKYGVPFWLPSLKLTVRPWKSSSFLVNTIKMVDFHGRTVSFREGIYVRFLTRAIMMSFSWNWNRGREGNLKVYGTDVEIVCFEPCTFEGAIFDVLRITIKKKYTSEIEHRYQRWPFLKRSHHFHVYNI